MHINETVIKAKIFDLAIKEKFKQLPIADREYINGLYELFQLTYGVTTNRTGIQTYKTSNVSFKLPIENKYIPRITGKYVYPKLALIEAVWMFMGRTDIEFLNQYGVNYWNNWVLEDGTIGNTYGKQIRDFNGIDQLQRLIDVMLYNPHDRRIIINLWNPNEVLNAGLPPCLTQLQIVTQVVYSPMTASTTAALLPMNTSTSVKFDLVATMRSTDSFLGLPYDFMLFAFMGHIIQLYLNHVQSEIYYVFDYLKINCGDFHAYVNHIEPISHYLTNIEHMLIDDKIIETTLWTDELMKGLDKDLGKDISIDDFLKHIENKIFTKSGPLPYKSILLSDNRLVTKKDFVEIKADVAV